MNGRVDTPLSWVVRFVNIEIMENWEIIIKVILISVEYIELTEHGVFSFLSVIQ